MQAERVAREYQQQAEAMHNELMKADPTNVDLTSITDFDSFAQTHKVIHSRKSKVSQEALARRKERYGPHTSLMDR